MINNFYTYITLKLHSMAYLCEHVLRRLISFISDAFLKHSNQVSIISRRGDWSYFYALNKTKIAFSE